MRPALATMILLVSASPLAIANDALPLFEVDVEVTGGDVILQVDVCGYGQGTIDMLGIDYGDPENLPLISRAQTDAETCAGGGYRYHDVIAEGAISPPIHCYRLDVAFTSATMLERLYEWAFDCD